LVELTKIVVGLAPIVPSSSTPQRVTLKNKAHISIVISQLNAASGMTGSAITLLQSTTIAGGGEKALAFTQAWRNLDISASDTLVNFAVASNTFTTDATASKQSLYVIEVNVTDLDINNGFRVIRAGTANATNSTVSVIYILWPDFYTRSTLPSAILD